MNNIHQAVLAAAKLIQPFIRETVLEYSTPLSREYLANIYLKCENSQQIGAFKVRGALNKLLRLTDAQRNNGVVTASSGNHGAAVAFGLKQLNLKGKIFVPETVSSAKLSNIKNYHEEVELFGNDCMLTELHARDYAASHGITYISPYNDIDVICGQGTIALELVKQLQQVDAVFVPIGGGGLIAGIAGCLKALSPATKIIGCMPENSPVMEASIKAGKIIEMDTLPTLSDATAGGIEADAITFELCQQYVDDYVLVTEDEIKSAIVKLIGTHRMLTEGAAGTALAAAFKLSEKFRGKNVVVVLSGGNISLETLRAILK